MSMTSFPVMVYAVFDFEYTKEQLMTITDYYRIGLNNECFDPKLFLKWVFYALSQAFIIYFICMICLNEEGLVTDDGKELGFWF